MDVFDQLRAVPRELLRKYADHAGTYSVSAGGWTAREVGGVTRFEGPPNGARFVDVRTENARAYIPLLLADTAQEKDAALLGLLSSKDRIGILQRLAGGSADMNGRFHPLRRDGGKAHIIDRNYGTAIGTVEREVLHNWARKITIEDVPEAVLAAACGGFDSLFNGSGWQGGRTVDGVILTDPTGAAVVTLTYGALSRVWRDRGMPLTLVPHFVRVNSRMLKSSENHGWISSLGDGRVRLQAPCRASAEFSVLDVSRSLGIEIDSVPDELLVDPIHNERAWNGWLLEVGKDRVWVSSPQNTRIETTLEELEALRRERAQAEVSADSLQADTDPKPEASAPEAATPLDAAAVPQALKEYAAHLVRGYIPPSVRDRYNQLPDGWSLLNVPVGARVVTCKGPDGIVSSVNLDDVPVAYALEYLPPDVAIAAQKLAHGLMGGEPTSPRWSLTRNECGRVEVRTPSGDTVPISGEIAPPVVAFDDIHPAAVKYARDLCAETFDEETRVACRASGWEVTLLAGKRVRFTTPTFHHVMFNEEFVLRGAAPPVASGESVASMPDMATSSKTRKNPPARTKASIALQDVDPDAIKRALELIIGDTTDPARTDWSVVVEDDDVLFTSAAGAFARFSKSDVEKRHREIRENLFHLGIEDVPFHAVRRALQLLADVPASESTWSVHVVTPESIAVTAKDLRRGHFSEDQIASRYYDLRGADGLYADHKEKSARRKALVAGGYADVLSQMEADLKSGKFHGSLVVGPRNTRENSMSEIVTTIKNNITEASWRTAGSQFVKLAREPLVGLLSRHLGPDDESMRARVASFLETELGTAMLAALLSAGLGMVPGNASVAERLSHELRIRAMADAGDVVADVLMGPLRQVMSMYLRDGGDLVIASAPAHLAEGAPHIAAVPSVPAAERTR